VQAEYTDAMIAANSTVNKRALLRICFSFLG